MKKWFFTVTAVLATAGSLAFGAWGSQESYASKADVEATAAEGMARAAEAKNNEAEDVTAQFVANPSFEEDDVKSLTPRHEDADGLRGYELAQPKGWTVSGDVDKKYIINKDCYTDNNFGLVGGVSDGEQAFYMRRGWSGGSVTLSQVLKALPAGRYKVAIDQRTAYANSASSSFSLSASGETLTEPFVQGGNGCFGSQKWATSEVVFTTTSDGDVKVDIAVNWVSGGSCIMIDNVKLYRLSDDYVEPEEPTESSAESPTEGVITHDFVAEAEMKDDLMQMLADFATYMKNDFQDCVAPNSVGEVCGCFKGENTMGNNEQGVRPNADLSMVCAFLSKYGKEKVTLPKGVTWNDIDQMAMKSLVFAYSTHKANKLKVCAGNNYWGSTSASDYTWESSLWAMSVAYSAFFQWDNLSEAQKGYIKALLKAECNYELQRGIPTGFAGDTKAEENGWETNVLAAALGLFPDDELAPKWFERMREFAINCYSHIDDKTNTTVIDPWYDNKTVADLYKGQNLYDDYTLQNHNLFHTSYQNVVMQELGESALALKMFQMGTKGEERWKTNALMHNNQKVMDEVLNWLALADGELAMPNGNDWSLFLYDQITSYTTMACFLKDPNALMLENLAYKYIQARQKTTSDGSWLLRADVGARRMGVEAHRVMMTWLMHEMASTADLTPTAWSDFNKKYSEAKILKSQNIVRASSDDRFTCFSWSTGLSSYTGYIAANNPDKNKIIVPFRSNNTGNILGWYTVSGKGTNATPVVSGIYNLSGNSYTMNGELNTNDASLNNRFALYSTPGNAVIYIDYVRGNASGTITKEQGGLMAISVDEFTKTKRTFYTANASGSISHTQSDGAKFAQFDADWANIDNEVGFVSKSDKKMAFGDRSNNNSIMTAKFYTSYSDTQRTFNSGEVVDRRNIVYYSNATAEMTAQMASQLQVLTDKVAEGWNGVIAADPDGTNYLLLSNFVSDKKCELTGVKCELGAPVFTEPTMISGGASAATFMAEVNHSVANVLKVFVKDADLVAVQAEGDSYAAYLQNESVSVAKPTVTILKDGKPVSGTVSIAVGECVKVYAEGGELRSEKAEMPSTSDEDLTLGYTDITNDKLMNANFEEDKTYGDNGNITLGSVSYNPCYVNKVTAKDSKFPNILPVEGWTTTKTLSPGSNYARMYSMPYSTTMFCVSPSNVGNYAAQCTRPMADEACGDRCLTVLNSWTAGDNKIVQSVTLPKGDYRLVMDMKYECTNQQSNDGRTVIASGNTNRSLTGVKYGSTTDYRYPSENATWEVMVYDFTLDEEQQVEICIGFNTSSGVGAANNTLIYADNIRLLAKEANEPVCISEVKNTERKDVYSISGVKCKADAPGVYIIGGKKVLVK